MRPRPVTTAAARAQCSQNRCDGGRLAAAASDMAFAAAGPAPLRHALYIVAGELRARLLDQAPSVLAALVGEHYRGRGWRITGRSATAACWGGSGKTGTRSSHCRLASARRRASEWSWSTSHRRSHWLSRRHAETAQAAARPRWAAARGGSRRGRFGGLDRAAA